MDIFIGMDTDVPKFGNAKSYIDGKEVPYGQDGEYISPEQVEQVITDEWIRDENYCDDTIRDMRDCIVKLSKQLKREKLLNRLTNSI